MSLSARFRPIDKWPGKPTPAYAQKRAPFRASYSKTLELLEKELWHIDAKNVVIQAGFDLRDIRNDGWPRSSARPKSAGVILSFESQGKPLMFPCDTYDAWEDNLRAIALSLEALRAVNRYGVTKQAEQYRGFAQLPAAGDQSDMTTDQAADYIEVHSGTHSGRVTLRHKGSFQDAYRNAARKLHPDSGGNHEQFVTLQRAKRILELIHGGA